MGLWANYSGTNSGVVILGDASIYETDNTGVFICGSPSDKQLKNDTDNVYITKRERNTAGIMILGSGCAVENSSADNNSTPARLVFPSNPNRKAKLQGHVQLDNNCTIYDSTGTKIIENGKLVAK